MLMVFFSWTVIAGAALIFGKAITDGLYRGCSDTMRRPDIYIMTGLIFLNVYAQFFSLFYKVAGIACTILGVTGIVILAVYGYRWFRSGGGIRSLRQEFSKKRVERWRWVAFAICFLLTLLWDIREPFQYDTGLYHAQAIHWIEEYAVVPGLGNLHMRLAYNSAFMCLQALFSLVWLLEQSLHTLNGFFCLAALAYVCFTVRIWGKGSLQGSDLLKCVMLIFVVQKRYDISSSGTDIWAMLLILYIFVKWSEYMESKETDGSLYGYLVLVGVYAVTVKLSAASTVALVCYPLYWLIKEKKWRSVFAHAAGGFLILLPWLIRNVILSGFLIYPFGALDLFRPDWKMDKAVLEKDSLEIKMYARGTPRTADYETAFTGWISKWFLRQSAADRVLILLGAVCVLVILYLLWKKRKEKCLPESALLGAALLNIVFWLLTAPAMRYGGAYIYILIAVTLGSIGVWRLKKPCTVLAAGIILVCLGLYAVSLREGIQEVGKYVIDQPDYINRAATLHPFEDEHIWMPDEGDMTGYWNFPATPAGGQLRVLKMRGESFQEEFAHE